jgi:D-methionine transport system permease protein
VVDKVVSLFRSIPFIILLTLLLPLTRIIMGTAIGVEGAIVPLVFGCTPFFARQVESALSQVDHGLVEAALSMGNSPLRVVWSVYLRESIPSIARGATITAISLLSLTAMAGVVGAGGLGNFAVMYGHDRNMVDVTWVSVIVLVIMVGIIQAVGNLIARKATH